MGTCFGTEITLQYALHAIGIAWRWMCRCLNGKSLYVISAVSLLGIGTNIDVKMLLASYWSHLKHNDLHNLEWDAYDTTWKYIQWDLEACFSGVHPNTDALGNAWPPGCA